MTESRMLTFAELADAEIIGNCSSSGEYAFTRRQAAIRRNTDGLAEPKRLDAVRTFSQWYSDYAERCTPSFELAASLGRNHGERHEGTRAASPEEIAGFRRAVTRFQSTVDEVLERFPFEQGPVTWTIEDSHPERSSMKLFISEPTVQWFEYDPDLDHGSPVDWDLFDRYNRLWSWAAADIGWAFYESLTREGIWVSWYNFDTFWARSLRPIYDEVGYQRRSALS